MSEKAVEKYNFGLWWWIDWDSLDDGQKIKVMEQMNLNDPGEAQRIFEWNKIPEYIECVLEYSFDFSCKLSKPLSLWTSLLKQMNPFVVNFSHNMHKNNLKVNV